MTTVTATAHFCAGHRLLGHEGKCRYLHGHNYEVEIEVGADGLDKLGRVVDFSVLRSILGAVTARMDHRFLLAQDDVDAIAAIRQVDPDRPAVLLSGAPTAENIAGFILRSMQVEFGLDWGSAAIGPLPKSLRVICVRVTETPGCWAEVRG